MTHSVAGRIRPHELPDPPSGLSDASAELWDATIRTFEFRRAELAVLESALRALDRAEEARALVESEGLTVVTESSGAVRPHPACSIESQARKEFRIAWSRLGLVDASQGGGR